jgi:hypothetical protein
VASVVEAYRNVEVLAVKTSPVPMTNGVPPPVSVIVLLLASNALVPLEDTIVSTPAMVRLPPAVVVIVLLAVPMFRW